MDKRVELGDGRVVRVHVDDDVVVDMDDYRPPIDSDPDELDEGATEALVLVDPKPSTMLVEGAIYAVGASARHYFGTPSSPRRSGWHDWGKYVVVMVLVMALFLGLRFI